jgi:hypothetical protein
MKRKSWPRQFETASDLACRKTLGGVLDEQTKDIKACFLRQSSEGIDGRRHIHISKTMEI